jgi:RimJ/RimL family protein N-acetyltransferase
VSARCSEAGSPRAVFRTARLEVRHYSRADIPAHVALRADPDVRAFMHWREDPAGVADQIEAASDRILPDDRGWINLAVVRREDGEVAGDLGLRVDDAVAWLGLALLPSSRRLGLGRELIRGAAGWLRAHGVNRLRVEVDRFNAASLALFADLGFRVVEDAEDEFGPYRVLAGPTG